MVKTEASAGLKHLDLLSVHSVKSITCMLSTRLRLRAPPPMRGNYPAPPPHSSRSFVASQQAIGTEAEKQFVALILIRRTVSITKICISAPGGEESCSENLGVAQIAVPKGKLVLLNELQRYSCAQEFHRQLLTQL